MREIQPPGIRLRCPSESAGDALLVIAGVCSNPNCNQIFLMAFDLALDLELNSSIEMLLTRDGSRVGPGSGLTFIREIGLNRWHTS